jgi:ABC-2 type transport system ATP-binding protein
VRAGRLADLLAQLRTGAPERELSLTGPVTGQAEGVLRRAGFVPAEAGGLVWRSVERAGLDGAALLGALRAQNVPVAEIRVRAPRLETLYLDALRPRELTDPEATPLRVGAAG